MSSTRPISKNIGSPMMAPTKAIAHGNIHGAQFHAEKSHRFGMKLLGNFARM